MLEGLNEVDKARLLYGNWYARAQDSGYFKREWLQKADKIPSGAKYVRAWDKAATEPSDVTPHPDYTACTGMAKDKNGYYYIFGDHVQSNFDDKTQTYGRFRKRPGSRENIILSQAEADGKDCEVILPIDPGAAGVSEYQESAKRLIEHGIRVRKDPVPNNKSKLTRFSPFSSACENGLVFVVESSFTPKTLNAFYAELEAFDGNGGARTKKDDWCDSTSTAFNYLSKQKVIPTFSLGNSSTSNTLLSKIKGELSL